MKLEYVVSGTSYMRLSNPKIAGDDINVGIVNELLSQTVQDHNSHEFSMLYNAYTESSFGERFKVYKDNIKSIHADSGGLQVVTQGKTITPELKDKVYENQAQWADVGMCFDEIPVTLVGDRSDRNDVKGRFFNREAHEKCARDTGKNIKRQFEIFDKFNSKCKPFVILQGNCYDTYMEWANYILEEVPQEKHNKLGGIAMGAAALGTGNLEDIQRAFIASQVPMRDENGKLHIHILGVGALRRLLPYIIFLQNDLYKDVVISYDSTTHSRAVETGLYYMNEATVKFNRKFSNYYLEMYNDVNKVIDLGVSVKDFHKIMNTNSTTWLEENSDLNSWLKIRTAFILMSIHNFTKHVEKILTNPDELLKFARKLKLEHAYRNLYDIKDPDAFNYWYNNPYLGGSMKSAPVREEAPLSLEELFT